MKERNSIKSTVVLNKGNQDGFFDFNSMHDLSEVMKVLKRIIDAGESDGQ